MKSHNLIGHAGKLADLLSVTLAKKDRHKLLFSGNAGIGKSALADLIAEHLTQSRFGIETVNGRNVTIHVVKEWKYEFSTSCMYGTGWRVIVVNEVDLCQRDAQDALLSFLDEMPAQRAFIGTSNLDLSAITERFRTRFSRYEVKAPSASEIQKLLETREGLPRSIAAQIATLSAGNVRAALLDAEAFKNEHPVEEDETIAIQGTLAEMGI